MRPRLVHTLSLLLLATVLLAVLAMGGVSAWNLRNGFSDYLFARDVERLEKFAVFVAIRAEQAGGISSLEAHGVDMRRLLDGFAQQQGIPSAHPPPPAIMGNRGFGAEHRPPPLGEDAFGERLSIVDLNGKTVWGRTVPGEDALIERPIQVGAEVVAIARMVKLPPIADAVDANFLRRQYLGIASVAIALLVLALSCAWWVASQWVQPLLAIQEATRRIAQGEFGFRLQEARFDEIGDVMRNVNTMALALGRLEGARRKWIADMSHELRTPLTVLRGEIEALVDGIRPLNASAVLSLRDEVLSLAAVVNDLHLLAMSDLNALPCNFEEMDAVALVRNVMQRFEVRALQMGLTLQLLVQEDLRLPVHWDSRRVEQLLVNLLDNSFRYTDAPGQVVVTIEMLKNEITIDVDDTAPGVATADLDRLFEPLFRADVARSRQNGGSGLGLSICKAIVQAHHGTIQASPSPLGGVRMHLVMQMDSQETP